MRYGEPREAKSRRDRLVYLGQDLIPSCCNRDSGGFRSTVMAGLRASLSIAPCFELVAIRDDECTGESGRRPLN